MPNLFRHLKGKILERTQDDIIGSYNFSSIIFNY